MGFTHELAVAAVESIPGYLAEFERVFGTRQIDIGQVTTAIAAFEERLVTPNARFDKWLAGDRSALSAEELAGYRLFKSSGCPMCHNGVDQRLVRRVRQNEVDLHRDPQPRGALVGIRRAALHPRPALPGLANQKPRDERIRERILDVDVAPRSRQRGDQRSAAAQLAARGMRGDQPGAVLRRLFTRDGQTVVVAVGAISGSPQPARREARRCSLAPG